MPVGTPLHFERIKNSLAPLQCLLPPFLTTCVLQYTSHTQARLPWRYRGRPVSTSTITALMNTSRVPCVRQAHWKARLWRWQNVRRRLCSLPQTIDLQSHSCISHYTLITTMNSANMHVLCHRGQKDVTASTVTLNFCLHSVQPRLSLSGFVGKLRPLHGRAR